METKYFTQDNQQYFATGRLDYTATQKIRLFGSWLYQYARETGDSLPTADPIDSEASYQLNSAIFSPLTLYSHGLGFSAPNATYNVGADITLTPKVVSTTRFGYFFSNYHDFGWPTSAPDLNWNTSGVGTLDNTGAPLPAGLQKPGRYAAPLHTTKATRCTTPASTTSLNEDVAFFKSGWAGTHNFKVGYQLNHLSNVINQNGNVPFVLAERWRGASYPRVHSSLPACAILRHTRQPNGEVCAGQYGYADRAGLRDHPAISRPLCDWNHALFAQDAWTVGHGLTLNLGIRVEKENLPVPPVIFRLDRPHSPSTSHGATRLSLASAAAWGSRRTAS